MHDVIISVFVLSSEGLNPLGSRQERSQKYVLNDRGETNLCVYSIHMNIWAFKLRSIRQHI